MQKNVITYLFLSISLLLLVIYDLFHGLQIATDGAILPADELDRLILLDLRLPRVITAIIAGAALSISGLIMQTLFRNPMAGPYTLGVSGGASLGVALVTMLGMGLVSQLTTITAAVVGSMILLLVVIATAQRVRNNTSMLIVGLMFGALSGALVNLIQNFANPDALKMFITWTFGSLSACGWSELHYLIPIAIAGGIGALLLIRPLNGLALGEDYARALNIRVHRVRVQSVLVTGIQAGAVTAFCGPIAFIGVAIPHLVRGLTGTNNHRQTMPLSALMGATLMVLCDILTTIGAHPLPVSTVSAIFGAPVIVWIIVKRK